MTYTIPEPREVPTWSKKGQQPPGAVADLLRRRKSELAEAQVRADQIAHQGAVLAEEMGLALYRKRDADNASDFRTLFDALARCGVELVTHIGEPITEDLEEMADIVEWVDSADGIAPGCVAEAFEPEIRLGGAMVHRAKLICVLDNGETQTLTTTDTPQEDDHEN